MLKLCQNQRIRWSMPGVLLLISLAIYLGLVRPLAVANESTHKSLDDSSSALLGFLQKNEIYPSGAIYEEMIRLEALLHGRLMSMMGPPWDKDVERETLEAIYEEWGFAKSGSTATWVNAFQRQAQEKMGRVNEKAATALAIGLARALGPAGITEIENLGCDLLDNLEDPVNSMGGDLHSFGVSMR
ncbi:MAG: hypothetical protein KJ645_06570, partial [Planctomycetes bacterium]|nr:hypothetical protein [Planctomycetota bacterium]